MEDMQGEPVGGVLNYSCHPTVLGPGNLQISADYPGFASDLVEKRLGHGFVSLFLNGACADVNPRTCVGYDCHGTFDDASQIAGDLSRAATDASASVGISSPPGIRFESSVVGPLDPFGLVFELSALAIGDFVILSVPAEVFAATGLWLKARVATRNFMVAAYTNGYVGYIPTEDSFGNQDYETKEVCWVDRGGEPAVRTAAQALIEKVLKGT